MKSDTTDSTRRQLLLALGILPLAGVARAATVTDKTEGEVRKVDKAGKRITIKHGEIKNLGMPAMTMVFQAADPAMVDQVKVGDKVRFVAENPGGKLTVTDIQPMR